MSTPSPLQPQSQGALEEASSPKSRVRITVLTILALHVVVIGGLLLQGCDKRPTKAGGATNTVSSLPPLNSDTNYFSSYPGDTAAGANPGGVRAPGGMGGSPAGGAQDLAGAGAGGVGQPGFAPQNPSGVGSGIGQGAAASAGAPAGSSASQLPPAGSQAFAPITSPPPAAAPASPTTEHAIKKGETIGLLAKKYHVTEKAILEANPQVKPKNLKLDEKIIIPAAAPTTASAPATGTGTGAVEAAPGASAPAATGAGEVYLVKQGDTLAKIAKKFGISVKQLRAANSIKGDRIVPKQKLNIPAKAAAAPAPSATAARPAGQI